MNLLSQLISVDFFSIISFIFYIIHKGIYHLFVLFDELVEKFVQLLPFYLSLTNLSDGFAYSMCLSSCSECVCGTMNSIHH